MNYKDELRKLSEFVEYLMGEVDLNNPAIVDLIKIKRKLIWDIHGFGYDHSEDSFKGCCGGECGPSRMESKEDEGEDDLSEEQLAEYLKHIIADWTGQDADDIKVNKVR